MLQGLEKLVDVKLIKINKIKPLNLNLLSEIRDGDYVYFYEESIRNGGIGEELGSFIIERGMNVSYKIIAPKDGIVKQATVKRQLEMFSLDSRSIVKEVMNG